jgi:hypothetical protein
MMSGDVRAFSGNMDPVFRRKMRPLMWIVRSRRFAGAKYSHKAGPARSIILFVIGVLDRNRARL